MDVVLAISVSGCAFHNYKRKGYSYSISSTNSKVEDTKRRISMNYLTLPLMGKIKFWK